VPERQLEPETQTNESDERGLARKDQPPRMAASPRAMDGNFLARLIPDQSLPALAGENPKGARATAPAAGSRRTRDTWLCGPGVV
jgi:hypothetical protein